MGTLTLEPGEVVTEHWHPYSEEFLYCVTGDILVTLDGDERRLVAESAVHIPIGVRHRIVNDGDGDGLLRLHLRSAGATPGAGPRRHRTDSTTGRSA